MKTDVKRVDHLGIVAGVIKDLGIVELIDECIPEHPKEEISTGEAVAGMIINGLGFSNRPLSLTPQFFRTKAMHRFFRKGLNAEHFNRFKLGRALDACHTYGCSNLFAQVSMKVCQKESVDCRFNSEDTTSFSLTGEYEADCDEHTIEITQGFSKDHRPDLKQAIVEMMVSQDGGVPLVYMAHNGNTSDNKIFQERSKALIESFTKTDLPRYLIADSKLYTSKAIKESLNVIPFITRVPATVKLEQEVIKDLRSIPLKEWKTLDEKNRYLSMLVRHCDLHQRWIVVFSREMMNRSQRRMEKAQEREQEELLKELSKNRKRQFSCKADAEKSLEAVKKKAKLHTVKVKQVKECKLYESKGRPTTQSKSKTVYQVDGVLEKDEEAIAEKMNQGSFFVLATTIKEGELSDREVIEAYKRQNDSVEKGFRFLKDPVFFTSSLFVKKPERIEGLLMVMTLALLVYSIAQRMMRKHLNDTGETLPNQIKKETSKPTLRWIFQIMEGIDCVVVEMKGEVEESVTGITPIHLKILACFPPEVQKIYGVAA